MPCRKIKVTNQKGGYKKGQALKRTWNPDQSRFTRTFTEVDESGKTDGNYVGYDYIKEHDDGSTTLQGTAWLSAVKKAYRQHCKDFRNEYMIDLVEENVGADFEDVWSGLSNQEKTDYRQEAIKVQCEPMEITLRETTPGNIKSNFSFRERKYYVLTEPVAPKKVSPSSGSIPRIYRYVPKVYPMKGDETIKELKARKNIN